MIVMKGQDGSSKLHEPRIAYKVNSDDGGVSYVWHIQYERKQRFALNSQHLQRLLSHIYPHREKYYYTYIMLVEYWAYSQDGFSGWVGYKMIYMYWLL